MHLVQSVKTGPIGIVQTYPANVSATPGVVNDLGDLDLGFPCPVVFSSGLFPANDVNGDVRAIAVFDDGSGPAVFVGGTFTIARGITVNRVAKWNGTTWSALGSGLTTTTSPSVDALLVFDDGRFTWIRVGTEVQELPALFVMSEQGAELANYLVKGEYLLVQRLVPAAMLKLGKTEVRIDRERTGWFR